MQKGTGEGDLVRCPYVLLQEVDNRSLFTLHIDDWFIRHVRGNTLFKVFEVYTQASFAERKGKKKNKRGAEFSTHF